MNIKQLEAQALKLDRDDRASLAHTLLHSLSEAPAGFESEEIERLWAEECQRRLDDWNRHPEKGIPSKEVFRELRERFK